MIYYLNKQSYPLLCRCRHTQLQFGIPHSSNSRRVAAVTLSRDLDIITNWGTKTLEIFHASKTQSFTILISDYLFNYMDSFRSIGVYISIDLIWYGLVVDIPVNNGKILHFCSVGGRPVMEYGFVT